MANGQAQGFRTQADWCERLRSPFTAGLLRRAAADIEAGGRLAALCGGAPEALPLRFAGALHYAVLKGIAPEALMRFYRPEARPGAGLWAAVEDFLTARPDFFHDFFRRPPQTNEIMRAGALLPAFLLTARMAGLPLALREIGASAGLLLQWDRFFYHLEDEQGRTQGQWGNAAAKAHIHPSWRGAVAPLQPARVEIASKQGCDLTPLNPADAENRLRLQAYIWPDQPERLARLQAGLEEAAEAGLKVEPMDCCDFLARELAGRRQDTAMVIYHAVVWPYLPREKRREAEALIRRAGAQGGAPLAWLSFEEGKFFGRESHPYMEIFWRFWDRNGDYQEKRLGRAGAHGSPVLWTG